MPVPAYAMSGREIAYGAIGPLAGHAMCVLRYDRPMRCAVLRKRTEIRPAYAVCGNPRIPVQETACSCTERAYGPTRCTVLRQRMTLRDARY
eukprot:3940799-Rhodomonas_salina.6